MNKGLVILGLAICLSFAMADLHAVIIAGSNGFYNYRHHADACHAYSTLLKKGVPAKNIIVLAYDDVANDSENPFPGKLYNRPNGDEVYAACKIDYKGENVTAANFLAVLTGDNKTTKGMKVLNSNENDHVFINFIDHGAVGLVAVVNDYLYADDLLAALKTMHAKKMYQKLVFYMEACESGSMFEHLPTNLSIYAVTASNGEESSWGCYCPPEDVVHGKSIGSCLGDTFSVSWMEDSDAENLNNETLEHQFEQLLVLVNQSHPQQFGDLNLTNETVSEYLGNKTTKKMFRSLNSNTLISGQVDTRDTKLHSLKAKMHSTGTVESIDAYLQEARLVSAFDETFGQINQIIHKNSTNEINTQQVKLPENLECLKKAVTSFETNCIKFSDYGMKYIRNLAHICYNHNLTETEINGLIKRTCTATNVILE